MRLLVLCYLSLVLPTQQGSLKLFRFAGIQVFLHWTWFIVAVYEMNVRGRSYGSPFWNAVEYVSVFGIVLLHEFGHALACRQVGGRADQIVLWPLGGVAYVDPPQRPGATLWSIAAGPLVNVVLFPVFSVVALMSETMRLPVDFQHFVRSIWWINTFLLAFNLLPVYPLDGGQIFRSLLWFVLGRARSLMVAAVFGFVGVALVGALAFWLRSVWIGVLAAFILMNCWRGFKQAQLLAVLARLPRWEGYACPACHEPPITGAYWRCSKCLHEFDTFEHKGVCPNCGEAFPETACVQCGARHPFGEWRAAQG